MVFQNNYMAFKLKEWTIKKIETTKFLTLSNALTIPPPEVGQNQGTQYLNKLKAWKWTNLWEKWPQRTKGWFLVDFESKLPFHQRSSSIEGHLPSKVIFHRRVSSIIVHLPSKVFFHRRSSSIKGCLTQKSSSLKGCLTSKVVFHQKSSSINVFCP